MPYDSVKVRELLRSAPGHRQMPNGEYVASLAEQLSDAESALAVQAVQVRKAHEETAALQSRLDTEVENIRKLRAESQGHVGMVDALKSIAKSPKGAQKIAQQALFAAGITEETKTA